jgi:hypothetical protein
MRRFACSERNPTMSQAVLDEPQQITESDAVVPTPIDVDRWLPTIVLLGALLSAACVFAWFCQHSHELWWRMGHDRHAHYMYGLNLAMDLRSGDIVRLLSDFDKIRVWGPLHPALVAIIQTIAGPDHRLTVLPSLAGWVLAIWCAFLIPRRMLTNGGNAAGLLAACLVLVSPAHRAFATDCMYESLGGGLSLAVVYFYLVTVQERTRRSAVLLGLALSALFLHKYNYWLLVAMGLVLGEFARQPWVWLQYAWSLRDRLPRWIVAELKQPLNYVAALLGGAALFVAITGGGVISIAGRDLSIQEPHNLVHAAYLALFARWVWWYRDAGRAWMAALPETVHGVLVWHGGVIAVWFLMPKRLSYFIWFLSPFNRDQQRESVPFMHGLPYYLQAVQDDYLTWNGGIYLVLGALALFILAWRQLKPGGAMPLFFLLIAAYLSCQHPMLKHRFIHSWIAMTFVLGSVGLVHTAQSLASLLSERARPWAAGITCAAMSGLLSMTLLDPGHAQEGGIKGPTLETSPLRITDTYLPSLADASQPTIVSNVSARYLWTWTFIEQHHHHRMAAEIKHFKSFEHDPEPAKRWLESTRSDVLVLIDIHPGTVFDSRSDEYVDLAAFHQALAAQTTWTQTQRWVMPEGVTITVWRNTAIR